MNVSEQGVQQGKRSRYSVVPRTLVFLTSHNPESGEREILLLKGAPTKRLWANKYNGIGGHVEADEDVLAAARRELREETGIMDVDLTLRGVINVAVEPEGETPAGVAVFLFTGEVDERAVQASAEGSLAWLPVAQLETVPLVDDLYDLIPLLVENDATIYGHYVPQPDGTLRYRFTAAGILSAL